MIYLGPTQQRVIFTLTDAPVGDYNLLYLGATLTGSVTDALTVVPATPYEFETTIIGQSNILVDRLYGYKAKVKNLSNQTAFGIPFYIKVSGDTEILFAELTLTTQLPDDFATVDQHFFKVYDENEQDSVWLGAFTLLSLPPNGSQDIDFRIQSFSSTPFHIQTYVGQPFYNYTTISGLQNGTITDCGQLLTCQQCLLSALNLDTPPECQWGAMRLACSIANTLNGQSNIAIELADLISDMGSVADCTAPIDNLSQWLQVTAKGAGDAAAITLATNACSNCLPDPQPLFVVIPIQSVDPNDKVGMVGTNELNYIKNEVRIPYTIDFENMETATAPASEVLITDVIDTTTLNFLP